MGKRSKLYEIYFGPADSKLGHGYGQLKNGPLGSEYSLGGNYGIYDEPDAYDIDEEDEVYNKSIISKVDGQKPYVDIGSKGNRQSNYTGAYTNLAEKKHTTTAVQGISPNMTYRTGKGSKATKTAGNSTTYPILYLRPRTDMPAHRYGPSRSPLPRHNELDNNPIFSLDDLLNNHEVALHKHTTNVNRLRSTINEINDNFYDI